MFPEERMEKDEQILKILYFQILRHRYLNTLLQKANCSY